jgi:xanthine dehydrogenase YagS FAD-binding subunit
MHPFAYTRAVDVNDAVNAASKNVAARFIAGGTNLLDLMKETVERPEHLIDITHLPLKSIDETTSGGLRVGALVSNTELANDARIRERYPLVRSAVLAGATQQLRNAATTGGNLLQRTRCYYFYDVTTACNKRSPGQGCSALHGINRNHAILGASEQCIATHPSDLCVALAALDARVHVAGPTEERVIEFADFHRLPDDRPDIDTTLRAGELITAVELPAEGFARYYTYLKLRERLSYAFALVAVAIALRLESDRIVDARVALGGVAHKPWRDRQAERCLIDSEPNAASFEECARIIVASAHGYGHNDFKIELARRAIMRALHQAAAQTPQSQIHKRIR